MNIKAEIQLALVKIMDGGYIEECIAHAGNTYETPMALDRSVRNALILAGYVEEDGANRYVISEKGKSALRRRWGIAT